MKKFVFFASTLLLFAAAFAQSPVRSLSVTTKDGARHFLLAVPSHFAKPGPAPLVILLHGHGGSAATTFGEVAGRSPLSEWRAISERDGVLVAALDGVLGPDHKPGWNDCRREASARPATDDVAFADEVVALLARGVPDVPGVRADVHRVYVMGMSNGGIMSFRLAEQMQPRPAGVAAVSSSLPVNSTCTLTRAVPLLMIDGDADPVMPYGGGEIGIDRGLMLGAERTASAYTMLSEGKKPVASPAVAPLAPRSTVPVPHLAGDATTASLLTYASANAAFPVELLRIHGGGHVEPSISHHPPKAYAALIGTQNTSIEAAEFAWQFLRTLHD